MSQGGNTLGMEETHHDTEVMTLEEHAARRWEEARDPGPGEAGPVIRTSEPVPGDQGEEGDFTRYHCYHS